MSEAFTRKDLAQKWGTRLVWYLENKREILLARKGYGAPPEIRPTGSCRLMTFAVKLKDSADQKKVFGMEEEIALELGARLCTIRRHYGEILFVLPLPPYLWTFIDSDKLPIRDGTWVCAGYAADMQPVFMDIAGNSICPMLVAGRTGSGKTEFLKLVVSTIVQQQTPDQLKLIIQDPKFKFEAIQYLPHLQMPILRTRQESAIGIGWALREMNIRLNDKLRRRQRIVLIFDELIDVIGNDVNSDVSLGLGELARLGREMNINIIFASQRPDRNFLDALTAANIGIRVVGKVTDAPEATVACGMGGTPARNLEGKGDMITVLHGEVLTRFQSGMVSERRFAGLPRMETLPEMPDNVGSILEEMGMRAGTSSKIIQVPEFTVDELAMGLTGMGIVRLKQTLGMGQPRATRLRQEWALPLLDKLHSLGYTLEESNVVDKLDEEDEVCVDNEVADVVVENTEKSEADHGLVEANEIEFPKSYI